VSADDERERLAATFDRAAELYQRARPEYPSELYDHLVAITGLAAGARLLEVGCATGKATRPVAQRGFRITCIEPGAALAAAARANLADSDVEVVEARFEDWTPAGEPFALVSPRPPGTGLIPRCATAGRPMRSSPAATSRCGGRAM
jgi:cyclopropane fatty-acyl-phospholipid synthase-like methyltransferase